MGSRLRTLAAQAGPVLALIGAVALFGWLLPVPGYLATKLLLMLLVLGLAWTNWARTQRSAQVMARFVAALEHRDFQQSFRVKGQGAGLEELGRALDGATQRLRAERASGLAERRFAAALADEAPTPLLAIDDAGTVHLANKAARRLFRESDRRPVAVFARYGDGFAAALDQARPGRRLDARVRWNGLDQRAVLTCAVADRDGRPWRIVSVNIIQRELDAAELSTQTDLVRVLTHEIMNSLTPVTSLAASAAQLMARACDGDDEALGDARRAIEALARRASGIAHFVESYRAFGHAPSVAKARFAARPWADELARSFTATPQADGAILALTLAPERMQIDGDAGLLGQVLLNLLKNAAEAAQSHGVAPVIALALDQDDAGRVRIAVTDNGPGVPAHRRDEIFLPFFTTKRTGTGVGLSFARQVVLLHGGVIGVVAGDGPGATLQILL